MEYGLSLPCVYVLIKFIYRVLPRKRCLARSDVVRREMFDEILTEETHCNSCNSR